MTLLPTQGEAGLCLLSLSLFVHVQGLCLHGGYFEMLESGWKRREHRNMKFFWYEELKKDQKKIIKEICNFINYNLSEEQIDK